MKGKDKMMKLLLAFTCVCAGVLASTGAGAARRKASPPMTKGTFQLPAETADFKPGPDVEIVRDNCGACHSADYISTQPHGSKFGEEFWKAEVAKMTKVYGAPIDPADADRIVAYLAATYR